MIKFFPDINPKEKTLFGGKATPLGELMRLKINVPPGFAISANTPNIKKSQAEILRAFDLLATDFVAVRSSANIEDGGLNSFAGQFKTFLFVKKTDLIEKILACKTFLNSPKIQTYCQIKKINRRRIKMAVIVQKMIPSEISGVCFTANPVTGQKGEITIEACLGLGEALVSGKITPDRYLVDHNQIRKTLNRQEKTLVYDQKTKTARFLPVSEKLQSSQKLTDSHLKELVKLAKKIEKHYQKPMDIEWTVANNEISILQARPITSSIRPRKTPSPTVNPAQYDHLWDWGAPYLIAAIDLETFSSSGTWDFISHGVKNTTSLYVSKQDRKTLSEKGFSTYYHGVTDYEKRVRKQMRLMEKLLTNNSDKNLTLLTNKQLAAKFKKYLLHIYKLFENYDLTETIYTDKVERVLTNHDKKYDLDRLQKNVRKMGDFKLEQRQLINKVWDYKKGLLANYLDEIAKRIKLDFDPVQYHYRELINLLHGKKVIIPNRSIWIRGKFSSWQDILGNKAKPIIKTLSYFDKNAKTIPGTTSNRGQYTGKVRKINFDIETNYDKEISKMKPGEVLVSGSTGPEMILACQKAGAIITEEGGVISHAAIISRELNIPCITGTHIAGKLLNTGDLVEVDADNGLIRILKKTNRFKL